MTEAQALVVLLDSMCAFTAFAGVALALFRVFKAGSEAV